MPIELQLKLWEVLTDYRNNLLMYEPLDSDTDNWETFTELESSLVNTPGFREWEARMRPMWADDLPELG